MKESIQKILTVQRAVMLPWAEARQYKSWSDDFRAKNAADALKRIEGMKIDFSDLTDNEAELLWFGKWNEETGLRLIPMWLYEFIAPGQKLVCISGKQIEVQPDYMDKNSSGYVDNDHRGGVLAYGFIPKQ